jgi:hypothetical protein
MMDREIRLECLRLAIGANRATSANHAETPMRVMARAQTYFDFVTGKTAPPTDKTAQIAPSAARRK